MIFYFSRAVSISDYLLVISEDLHVKMRLIGLSDKEMKLLVQLFNFIKKIEHLKMSKNKGHL